MAETEEHTRDDAAEREARTRFMLANVRQYPDPVLRMPTREVEEFDDALATLVERMTRVMVGSRGVGLAAPQVGVLQRVFVYQPEESDEPAAIVNPRIVSSSDELEEMEEGCLSLAAATVTVDVERPAKVTIEGRTPAGDEVRLELEGLAARVVQHETDHLDGVLIIDRTKPEQRKAALAQLRPRPVLGPIS